MPRPNLSREEVALIRDALDFYHEDREEYARKWATDDEVENYQTEGRAAAELGGKLEAEITTVHPRPICPVCGSIEIRPEDAGIYWDDDLHDWAVSTDRAFSCEDCGAEFAEPAMETVNG